MEEACFYHAYGLIKLDFTISPSILKYNGILQLIPSSIYNHIRDITYAIIIVRSAYLRIYFNVYKLKIWTLRDLKTSEKGGLRDLKRVFDKF